MKLNIKESNLKPIRNVILCTNSEQKIAINEEDVDNLIDSSEMLSLLVSHGVTLKDALQKLDTQELDYEKATKALFVVQCSSSYQMPISELENLSQYINENVPKADVRWGFATNTESEENVTVVAVTSY